jgi:hypothetical protein
MRVALFGLNWFQIQGKDNNKKGCLKESDFSFFFVAPTGKSVGSREFSFRRVNPFEEFVLRRLKPSVPSSFPNLQISKPANQ